MTPSSAPSGHRRWARRGPGLLLAMACLLWAPAARAQYKNTAFGLDFAGEIIDRPPVTRNGAQLSLAETPDRLAHAYRFGGEFDLKLREDHWWFSGRINGGLYQYSPGSNTPNSPEQAFDTQAAATMGTILGLEGLAGLRYYFLTDHFRPYVQLGISYMHLFSFTGQGDTVCTLSQGYACSDTNANTFLAHSNIFAIHAPEVGAEFIVKRDLALRLFVDLQRWLIVNADDNTVLVFGGGLTFYG